jgi:hypothetical protein
MNGIPVPPNTALPQPEVSKERWNWISEATLIAATPFAAYYVSFAYQSGYAHFFGIPRELIAMDMKTFLISSSSLKLLVMMFVMLSVLFFGFWPHGKRDNPLYRRIVIIFIIFPGFFLSITSLTASDLSHWTNWLSALSPVLILGFVLFISPLAISRSKNKSIKDKLAEHDRMQRDDSVLAYYLRQGIGDIVTVGLWVTIAVQAAYPLGETEAKRKAEFLVRLSSPETVILAIYGDYLISAPFDKGQKTVEKSISVIKVGEAPSIGMRFESVGPLMPRQ